MRMGKQGRYRPADRYNAGQAVKLVDGREAVVIVDYPRQRQVSVRYADETREVLPYDAVEHTPATGPFTYEQWQSLGNHPSCTPGRST